MADTNIKDAVRLVGYEQVTPLATTTSAAETAALTKGIYAIWPESVDIHIKQVATGGDATDVTVANGYKLKAGSIDTIEVLEGDKIGSISTSSTTLHLHKISENNIPELER